jgi:hypothetical protein
MEISRKAATAKGPAETFTGDVWIADGLSVSLNTVNTHLRSIYAKLQVGGRSAAVKRARELRLLAPVRAPYPAIT